MTKILILIGLVVAIIVVLMLLLRNNSQTSSGSSSSLPAAASTSSSESASSVKKLNWLEGVMGEVKGKNYHVGQRSVTIGRAPTNFVQIMDSGVSRFHVRLTPVGNGLELQDMNSSSGTKVNNRPVTKATLKDGDSFRIGESLFIFRREAEFDVNEGLVGRKAIGGEAIKPTLMEEDGSMLDSLVLRALDEYHDDAIKVAQVTNLSVDVVENIRAKYKK